MNTRDAAANLVRKLADLRMDDSLPPQKRAQRGMDVVSNLLSLDDDDVLEQVLITFLRIDGEMYRFIASVIDEHLDRQTIKLPDGTQKAGTLFAISLYFFHQPGVAIPERIPVDFLPPLPDRRRIPLLSGAVLQWNDLYSHPSRIRALHALFATQGSSYDQQTLDASVLSWRGTPEEGWGNLLPLSNGQVVGQRFLVAYRLDGEASWFSDREEELQWLEKATHRVKSVVNGDWFLALSQPSRLTSALYGSLTNHIRNVEADFKSTLRDFYQGSYDDLDVLIEPFGVQESSIALYIRYSAISRRDGRAISWAMYPLTMRTIRVAWKEVCEIRSAELLRAGFKNIHCAQQVQPLELLPNALEGRRINVYFGPTVMVDEAPKEGLPFESAGDPSHSSAKWWKHHSEASELVAKAILTGLAAELGVPAESVVVKTGFALSLADFRWYSVAVFDVESALREGDGTVRWPPSDAALDAVLGFAGLLGAHLWVRHAVVVAEPE